MGLGASGGNALGFQNACIGGTANGQQCLPGCFSTADCADLPGTLCLLMTSVDGFSVNVCAPMPDASVGD
jgi:hypothetical protein